MQKVFIALSIISLVSCGRTIVDPAHTTFTRVTNGLKGPISVELYQNGTITETHGLKHNESFELSTGPQDGPVKPFADFDSMNVWFNSTIVKTDVNCDKLSGSAEHTQCLTDIVSLFLTDDYGQEVLENSSRWKYTIDVKDSVEAK